MKLAKLAVLVFCVVQISNAQDAFNKGKAALAAKDTAAAISAFQDAARAGQKNAETNYYLGEIAYQQGRLDEAITFLTASLRSEDENVDALMTLGDAYLEKKDNVNALAQFKKAAKLAPKDCRVPTRYGSALAEAGMLDGPEGAFVQLTRAQNCDPKNPLVFIALGDAYNKQGVPALATINYKKALELSPNDIETQLKIARAHAKGRRYNEAVEAYEGAVKIDSTQFDPYFEAGKIFYRAKLWRQAAQFLNKAVRLRPAHVETASMYAQSLTGAGVWSEAAKAGAVAVKLDSSSIENWRAYAYALVETQDYKNALNAFTALERRKGVKPEDYAKLSEALFRAGQEDKALEIGLKAVQADSSNCDPYFNLGFIYMKKQDYSNASKMFEKKIACDPRSLTAYINAGSSYMQAPKNLPRARELFVKAIELKPDYLQARLWMARYYAEVDSTDLMKQTYDEVIRLASEDKVKNKSVLGEAYTQLGSYYFTKKSYGAAVDVFSKAASSGVESSGLYLAWGQGLILTRGDNANEGRRKTEDAINKFRRAIQMDPCNAQAHFWLGNSLTYLRKEGDTNGNRKLQEEACSEYGKALKCDPRLDEAKKSRERIGCK